MITQTVATHTWLTDIRIFRGTIRINCTLVRNRLASSGAGNARTGLCDFEMLQGLALDEHEEPAE